MPDRPHTPSPARRRAAAVACALLLALAAAPLPAQDPAAPDATAAPQPVAADPAEADAPEAGTRIVHPVDGALMAWVPAGPFTMGLDRDEADRAIKALGLAGWEAAWAWEWMPAHRVELPGYFIDIHEVTRKRWERFASSGHLRPQKPEQPRGPAEPSPGAYALYPITRVYWAEARQYANWAGKQLPSEAQWEKAARGTDARLFPWGNDPPTEDHVAVAVHTRKARETLWPVGHRPAGASPYGCLDLAGNVYEWTADWHEPYPNNPERERMLAYTGHTNGVLRGGSFYHNLGAYLSAKRFGLPPDTTYYHIGFRTVWTPPPGYFRSSAYQEARDAVPARQAAIQALRDTAATPYPIHW